MTIQEYMRLAINGIPNADYKYYMPFFLNMDCEHCIYNGYACRSPKADSVCMDYRVERTHKQQQKPNSKYEKKVRG
jgi:hypothetical protein